LITAIAIDDEPIALDVIRSHAAKVPFLDLKAEFTDAFKAMDYLQREPVDLLFLDIKMPDISGIDLLTCLNKKPLVIFTTAYTEHAVTSFELDAVDYLLKPFALTRFIKACNKAFELYNFRNMADVKDYIFLKTGYEQVRVNFDDIYHLEATGNYVNFILKDDKVLTAEKFIRIHRSFIAAVSKIDKIERHQVTINGFMLPVGGAYVQNLGMIK
jgi:DNA-binding LytR/AlgR family response regulator